MYHDRVVSFLRQANILDILKSKYPAILSNMSLKNKVNMIRLEGHQAILKLKNDLELTVMLRFDLYFHMHSLKSEFILNLLISSAFLRRTL